MSLPAPPKLSSHQRHCHRGPSNSSLGQPLPLKAHIPPREGRQGPGSLRTELSRCVFSSPSLLPHHPLSFLSPGLFTPDIILHVSQGPPPTPTPTRNVSS